MQGIKSFVYLDEYKMYSISSQIFGGLTEYLIDYQGTTKEEDESQRGPLGSGRVMADILKSESRTEERKYLHDYSYTLFEQRLYDDNRVVNVSAQNFHEHFENINDTGFIAVSGKAIFNDMRMLKATMKRFNDLGEAITYVSNFEEIQNVREKLDESVASAGDRNTKAQLRQRLKTLNNIAELAKSKGLQQDSVFLEKLEFLLDYGFQDQFEVQIPLGGHIFSANLKREYLRDDEELLVKKYSRFSKKGFVLFGTIAQSATQDVDANEYSVDEPSPEHMKVVIMQMVEAIAGVEAGFSGKLENEFIIDPIALYREI